MLYDLSNINKLENEKIFVDANVLIFWNWSTGKIKQETDYSSIYAKLLEQRNHIYVDFIVISEVINRLIKIETKKNDINIIDFKKFRNSEQGKEKLKEIYSVVQERILDNFDLAEKHFTKENILEFLSIDSLDFNDKAILKICKENNFILLTDDIDFRNSDVDILTCNKKITQCK
ncbi:MAG: PIN domain-containing protein [Bacteroidales bacterium]|jgi:predicted nucleic acid-binding protein|nr:PIN domain-containing protein [Bacteroidales bacterium]